MQGESARPLVRIAAAVIRDAAGRYLLVRKCGTIAFMQAGGKIEADEDPLRALRRELQEELGLVIEAAEARYLGCFEADAANEPGYVVEAELFGVLLQGDIAPAAEIAEFAWVRPTDVQLPPLAPLTRRHVLGLET